MSTYRARMMDAETGGEGSYDFEAEADLFTRSPVRIVRRFMEHVDRDIFPKQHVDYELNAALKNDAHQVVTAMGLLVYDQGRIPFLLMIAPKR